jgi:hypothetical protein
MTNGWDLKTNDSGVEQREMTGARSGASPCGSGSERDAGRAAHRGTSDPRARPNLPAHTSFTY